jgi:antitoxin CcdA
MREHDTLHTGGGKTRTNVSVDAELLALARELRINVSAALEGRLKELVAESRSRSWLEDHAEALKDANKFLEQRGLWSDGKRRF